ncbi:rhomboid family intramembrane serine protease [Mariprofundus erugo]|uniref:Rhomboid family intramembrane serine protease n=2 Tax=Mariprofundus erugo TaxID=2528639 RepID=A0A5R9GZ70_9PROT|nr:rhomboid family intramembrane serine protease [Mariprofundus erugo]TLS75286.1 rhomboid family intramembrane serine protease [Mariprofundus erugo]
MSPEHVAVLAYDRHAIVAGEWWRLWTGHLTHARHVDLLVNSALLFLFGVLSFRFTRIWQEVLCYMLAMPALSGLLLIVSSHTQIYHGASGLAAMAAMIACWFLVLESERFTLGYWLGVSLLLAFAAKVGLDGLAVLSPVRMPRPEAGVGWMVQLFGTLMGLAFFNALHQGAVTSEGRNVQYQQGEAQKAIPRKLNGRPPRG